MLKSWKARVKDQVFIGTSYYVFNQDDGSWVMDVAKIRSSGVQVLGGPKDKVSYFSWI